MKTRFMTMDGGFHYEKKYYNSLFEALTKSDEIYEVNKKGESITWIWRELPQKVWHIVDYKSKKNGKEAETFEE